MEVSDGQDALLSLRDPFGLRQCLAGWTVPIAARIELVNHYTTIRALTPVPAERSSEDWSCILMFVHAVEYHAESIH